MPVTPAWLASVEALLNRNINATTQAATLMQRLEQSSLQVDAEGMTRVRALIAGGRLALVRGDDSPADATITGSPMALLQMVSDKFQGNGARPAQVRGNAEIASLYRQLLALARPDWEEELSRLVGDIAARRLSQMAERALSWARGASRTVGNNIAEYLTEESRDLVNKVEHEEFLSGVDALRETADRVEARLLRLELRLQGSV